MKCSPYLILLKQIILFSVSLLNTINFNHGGLLFPFCEVFGAHISTLPGLTKKNTKYLDHCDSTFHFILCSSLIFKFPSPPSVFCFSLFTSSFHNCLCLRVLRSGAVIISVKYSPSGVRLFRSFSLLTF